ncbi:MAG: hypothetical protein Q8M18_03445 [Bradyrhizobium sp.]|nr:hypothetical protein [Bradyrhizobium sp.]
MAQVIMLDREVCARSTQQSPPLQASGIGIAPALPVASRRAPRSEDVYRAILLLDQAAQHARLLVKYISDSSRRANFEAQIAAIDHLLQIARGMALRL